MDRAVMRTGRARGARAAAWVLVPVSCIAAASGCGALGSRPDEVLISQSDLAGAWTNGDGMTPRFDTDHHVASRVQVGSCELDGTWEFHVCDSGASSHSDRADTGGYGASVSVFQPHRVTL